MKKSILLLVLINLTLLRTVKAQFDYPKSKEIPVIDTYFGTQITDNYRWLENMSDTTVLSWIKSQAEFSNNTISKIKGREKFNARVKEYMNMGGDIFGEIVQKNDSYFYTKTIKGESLSKLCKRTSDNKEEVLFDPETLGKKTQISGFEVSDKGEKIALILSNGGGEICNIRVFDLKRNTLLPDVIGPVWSQFSVTFVSNSTQIIYTKLKSSDTHNENLLKNTDTYLHEIGTDSKEDKVLFSREKYKELDVLPEKFPEIILSEDKKYLLMFIASVKSELFMYYAPIDEIHKEKINWKPFITYDDKIRDFYIVRDNLYFLTHKNAPRYKICLTSLSNPNFDNAQIIVPQSDGIITGLSKTKNYLVYSIKSNNSTDHFTYNLETSKIKKTNFPLGTNSVKSLNRTQNDKLIVSNTNWLTPTTVYEYDIENNTIFKSKKFDKGGNYPDLNENFEIKEIEVKSHDGVMVPLSIIYPKNIKFDGSSTCFISGYGAYGSSRDSRFIEHMAALLEQGVVLAITHVRGGGEKGKEWHEGGMKSNKPNTWKDFIACTEYMINQKYTSPERVIGSGVSAGGILIGRAISERPELYGVALCQVGFTNILRSETTSNGDNQIPEFGSVKVEKDIKNVIDMDVQSKIVKGVKYPAVLLRSGMNDARVVPWMPAKLAAVLQNNSISQKPVLLYVNYANGHFTSDLDVISKEYSDMLSYALWQAGHPNFN